MFLEAGIRGNHQKLSIKNITKFTGKHLCRSLLINISAEASNFFIKRLQQKRFPVYFAKSLKTFLQNTCGRLLLRIGSSQIKNTPWHTGIGSIQ